PIPSPNRPRFSPTFSAPRALRISAAAGIALGLLLLRRARSPRAAAGAAALVEARRHLSVLSTADDLPPPPPQANGGVGAPLGAKGPAPHSPLPAPAPPSLSRAWADKPGFRRWKDKEAEILSVIEPIIALAKDILHSNREDYLKAAFYLSCTALICLLLRESAIYGMADIFLEKSQKSRCGGGYCRREASILDRLQHSNSNFQ
ncbi:hypothetical protein ACMD2_23240, partial [Ananas comosus]